jgi:hypothetical protein
MLFVFQNVSGNYNAKYFENYRCLRPGVSNFEDTLLRCGCRSGSDVGNRESRPLTGRAIHPG